MAIDWNAQFNQDLLSEALAQSVTKDSQSNSVADKDNPDMINMLMRARQLGDSYQRALEARQEREQLEATPRTSGKQELFSADSIPIGLAMLAAAFGGQPQAAAGLAIGAMEGSTAQAASENQQRDQAIGEAYEREGVELNRIQRMHDRANQQLVANWQAIVRDGEQAISSEAAGFLALGAFGMPMDFTAKAKAMELSNDPGKRDRVNFLFQVGKLSDTQEDAEAFARDLYVELGRGDVSEEEVQRLGRALFQDAQAEASRTGRPTGDSLVEKLVLHAVKEADIQTLYPALQALVDVDNPLEDVGWMADLTWHGAQVRRGLDVDEAQLNNAIEVFSAYVTDPANAEIIESVYSLHGRGTGEALRNIAINAFDGQENLLIAFDKYADLHIDMGLSNSDIVNMAVEYQQTLPLLEVLVHNMMKDQPATRMEQIGGTEKFMEMLKSAQNLAAAVSQQTAPIVLTAEAADIMSQARNVLAENGYVPPNGQEVHRWVSDKFEEAMRKYPNDYNAAIKYFDNAIFTILGQLRQATPDSARTDDGQ